MTHPSDRASVEAHRLAGLVGDLRRQVYHLEHERDQLRAQLNEKHRKRARRRWGRRQ